MQDASCDEGDGSFSSSSLADIVNRYARYPRIRLTTPGHSSHHPPGLAVDYRRLGQVGVARSRVSDDMTVTTDSADVYALALVGSGGLRVDEGRRQWSLTPATAGLYRPPAAVRRNRIAAGTELMYLQIERRDLERHLEALIGQYVEGPVDFRPELPTHGEPTWLRLFRVYAGVFDGSDTALHRPIVGDPLREAMINAVLYAADHRYRGLLHRPAGPARPRHIRQVIEAIHAEPERAYTVALLARIGGTSVRSLQQGFRDHVGLAPTAYLRRVRLERAHSDLLSDGGDTVARVAHRWGFTHLGRFAAAYASVYGVAPSAARERRPAAARP
ncbi:AraC family transcriptional regulator [Actinoplanes sp. Pm04-4]|uniref:AraC family transcriptional regulator n=1 Tax=Paractinoplanes pyxinae TaxID=2997416 RepID=A0ABT4AQF7_9ACTN|nr:AraC family transcriptional regulator [Actinoplanes pyxinae]MCY1136481.1 AraC family transcriptional regulator [Actinoplanes pyxinae]